MDLKIVNAQFKNGISKKNNQPYVALELTLQGSEKFTVSKMIFLDDTQYQMLGIEKPKS